MIQKILEWMKKHYFVSLIIIFAILGGLFSDNEKIIDSSIKIQEKEVTDNSGVTATSIEEIVLSEYKNFFDAEGFNRKLKDKLGEENQNQNIEILRASYFTSDDMKQILINTYYTLDGIEHASNSRHNIDTNEIEEFYSNSVE